MLDPNTNTRRQFTNGIIETFPVPDDAAQDWRKLAEDLKELTAKLAFHDAMKPNIDQGRQKAGPCVTRRKADGLISATSIHDPSGFEEQSLLHVGFRR